MLDAGCGRGHLIDGLRRCGHWGVGIDSSPTAIDLAREQYGGTFERCELVDHKPDKPYDVVICIDVLFHILSDDIWRKAIGALCRYTSAEAVLILTDVYGENRFTLGDYIVHRPKRDYQKVLAAFDFEIAELSSYQFGTNPNSIAACQRRIS